MANGSPRSARIVDGPPSPWVNRHKNVEQVFDKLYEVANPPEPVADFFGDLKLTVAALQGLIAKAAADSQTLRAIGGGWSLSQAAVTDGRMIDTGFMNWVLPVDSTEVTPDYTGDPGLLIYLQCGIKIDDVNTTLAERPQALALKTMGASNGQTIAGAVSTGTHGSRFEFGSMQDYVVGIHLITGPDRVIWLERKSYPVISDALAAKLGAEIVRDDTLFDAALVSFGSFGIIHGLMVETEKLYRLEIWRRRIALDDKLKLAMRTLDFSGLRPPLSNDQPLHFEVVVNPHDTAKGAFVTTMYRRDYQPVYKRPALSPSGLGPGDGLLGSMGKLGDAIPAVVGPLVNALVSKEYRLFKGEMGTPGEIFDSTFTFQKEMSAEIGVALEDTVRALDVMLSVPELKGYAGLLAFRWVRKSKALLAFTKFDITCAIELPAAFADRTVAYYNAVWNEMEAREFPTRFIGGR